MTPLNLRTPANLWTSSDSSSGWCCSDLSSPDLGWFIQGKLHFASILNCQSSFLVDSREQPGRATAGSPWLTLWAPAIVHSCFAELWPAFWVSKIAISAWTIGDPIAFFIVCSRLLVIALTTSSRLPVIALRGLIAGFLLGVPSSIWSFYCWFPVR